LRSTGEEDARCVQSTSATQTTCVHPHLARSRFPLAGCPAGRPHGVLGSVRPLAHRGTGRFTTSETASADRHVMRTFPLSTSRPGVGSVGVFFPRHACDRASDTPVANRVHRRASPGFPGAAVSPWPRVSLLERLARVGRCAFRRDPLPRRLVKGDASADPGCLPSTGTLPRIRWPLQPRSRDRRTAFRAMVRPLNDALASPWVFVRSSPAHTGDAETPTYTSLLAPNDGVTRRPSPEARPPFTRPCSIFWSEDRAYSRPDAA
jgi:hypothetical protein